MLVETHPQHQAGHDDHPAADAEEAGHESRYQSQDHGTHGQAHG